jgi:hypothetical protein
MKSLLRSPLQLDAELHHMDTSDCVKNSMATANANKRNSAARTNWKAVTHTDWMAMNRTYDCKTRALAGTRRALAHTDWIKGAAHSVLKTARTGCGGGSLDDYSCWLLQDSDSL